MSMAENATHASTPSVVKGPSWPTRVSQTLFRSRSGRVAMSVIGVFLGFEIVRYGLIVFKGEPTPTTVTLASPATIGDLTKLSDQSVTKNLLEELRGGIEHPFGAVYEDSQRTGEFVVVWGGTGTLLGGDSVNTELNGFFSSTNAGISGQTIEARADVSAGPTGGVAQCENVYGSGGSFRVCGWLGRGGLLGFIFTGYLPAEADALLPNVLSGIVQAQ
jgi:hypothetical protein